ncbi:MAG: chemotaxis protein CheW [Lautropia sp.]
MSHSDDAADDLSEFHDVFFDEADEHLTSMEALLLGIDTAQPDPEHLNAIFRAAHSIKGGAGVFGFADIAALTHEMETVFDRVRKQTMALSNDVISVFLRSGDTLKAMVTARRGNGAAPAEAAVEALCERLRQFIEAAAPASAEPTSAVTKSADAPTAIGQAAAGDDAGAASATLRTLEIIVADPSAPATEPRTGEAIQAALQSLGESTPLALPATPAGARFGLRLVSRHPPAVIADALAFLVAPEHTRIRVVDPAVEAAAPETPATPTTVAPSAIAPSAVAPSAAPAVVPLAVVTPSAAPSATTSSATTISAAAAPAATLRPPQPAAPAPVAANSAERPKAGASSNADASSIRVSVQKIDQLINLVGELVITQAMLTQTAAHVDPVLHQKLLNGLGLLQRNTRDLQESAMSIRMLPMSFVFGRFPRVVRDLAGQLNKRVELVTEGETTELDKGLIERIIDPLTHLVRNSLDHGIESPARREAAGKPAVGTLTLRAFHRGGNIMIEVVDDGGGLDRDRILAKARERGMNVGDAMSDSEVFQLIFEAGFSTAEKVTDVSGRGVGMDVVKRNIRSMGGNVDISSTKGAGTRITIRLPLTLAILEGMSVSVGDEVFIVPLTHIIESLQPSADQIRTVAGRGTVVRVRGEYLPVVTLQSVFGVAGEVRRYEQGIMVVLEEDDQKIALFVDALLGQHQVVIKSLETNYRKVAGVSGATIMGDGRVALILDVAGLIGGARSLFVKAA